MRTIILNGAALTGYTGETLKELLGSDWLAWYLAAFDWALSYGRIEVIMGYLSCEVTHCLLNIESDLKFSGRAGTLLAALLHCNVLEVINGGMFLNEHFFIVKDFS